MEATTIAISPELKIEVALNPWGKPTINLRSKRRDGAFKNLYITKTQWESIVNAIGCIDAVLAQLERSGEDRQFILPIDEKKSIVLDRRGRDTTVSIQSFKEGEIEKNLACVIGDSLLWGKFVFCSDGVNQAISDISRNTPGEAEKCTQYKWTGIKKDGSNLIVEGDFWVFTKDHAHKEALKKVNYYLYLRYLQ